MADLCVLWPAPKEKSHEMTYQSAHVTQERQRTVEGGEGGTLCVGKIKTHNEPSYEMVGRRATETIFIINFARAKHGCP